MCDGKGGGGRGSEQGTRKEGKKGTSSEWMRYALEIVRNASGYLA